MLKNYFKTAWRNLLRNKVYSAINIAGLAIGISACVLIFLYVQDELTYERHFDKKDRIVRVATDMSNEDKADKFALTSYLLAPALAKDYPEIEKVTRVMTASRQTVWVNEQAFNEENLYFADSTFFDIFSYEFVKGDPKTALVEPKSIVITEQLANKYFGSADAAYGQMLKFSKNTHKVTGIIKNPGHSHLTINALMSLNTIPKADLEGLEGAWFRVSQYTYLLLQNPEQVATFQSRLDDFYERNVKAWVAENAPGQDIRFVMQPLESIHFDTTYGYDISPAGNKQYVYIFSFVAIFVLLIACINYMNLSTARSSKRAKEVGLRKVIGAYRSQIIGQFIGESVFITLIALVLALALVELSLPFFNELTDKHFTSGYLLQPGFLLALLAILVFVGLVAGSYPAFILSAFKPVDVLKSDKSPRGSSALLRKSLVVLQFTISLVMIIGTLVVLLQMNFLKNKELGFRKEQVLVIDIPGGDTTLVNKLSTIKQEFLQHPNIDKVATSAHIPGDKTGRLIFGVYQNNKEIPVAFNTMWVDYDFMDLMEIELKEGRKFSKETPTDATQAFIINEAAARILEQDKALGTRMTLGIGAGIDAKVIGVVKDFHYKSLHNEVEPMVMLPTNKSQGYLLARVQAQNLPQTIAFVKEKWQKFDTKHPMEYFFLDEKFNEQYRSEERMLAVFGYFAALTILIACLGLFGLASFTAEQRTKEIGIRKVLGSSVTGIVLLLSKDFALLVLVAIVLASPVAWYGMQKWLQDFAYRTDISPWIFVFSGLAALLIAMLTVSSQAAKAALVNPVKSLRAE